MIGSKKVRVARKKGQLERVKLKKKAKGNEYAEYFAKLPKQIAKAKITAIITDAKNELTDALEALQIAQEIGEGLLAAEESVQVAVLTISKGEESLRYIPAMTLTATGFST